LACTAALASLDLLMLEDCFNRITWITEQNKAFAERLTTHDSQLTIKNIRTLGTIIAFEIVEGKDEYLNNIATTITQKALEEGVYIRPLGNTVYIMPPYCITEEELEIVYEVILNLLQ
jgi:adenosylmethionine-8-amino-7-oxononanoate aminotransferase